MMAATRRAQVSSMKLLPSLLFSLKVRSPSPFHPRSLNLTPSPRALSSRASPEQPGPSSSDSTPSAFDDPNQWSLQDHRNPDPSLNQQNPIPQGQNFCQPANPDESNQWNSKAQNTTLNPNHPQGAQALGGPASVADLIKLCQEGKINQVIECLQQCSIQEPPPFSSDPAPRAFNVTNQWSIQDHRNPDPSPNQWNPMLQGQNFHQPANPNELGQWNSKAQNTPLNPNHLRSHSYPRSLNPNLDHSHSHTHPRNLYTQQHQSPKLDQWNPALRSTNKENYPNRGIPNLGQYPQSQAQIAQCPQNPVGNQWNTQAPSFPHGSNSSQSPDQAPDAQAPVGPASVADLMRLCQEGNIKEVIECLEQGAIADGQCFFAFFEACGNSKVLKDAKKVHDFFLHSMCRDELELNNKVLDMYAKCGSMVDACRVFDHMPDRDMSSWHLMINGYATNELGDDGLQLFEQMRKLGLQPNGQTFLVVLAACASVEAVEEGFIHFESMKSYGVSPRLEHYMGLLDVLGKSGHLMEAKDYIENLPVEVAPTSLFWESLFNYAKIHGDVDLEDFCEEVFLTLDPSKSAERKFLTRPAKNQSAINMLDGKNRLLEFQNLTLYRDDEEMKAQKEVVHVPLPFPHDIVAKKEGLVGHVELFAIGKCIMNTPLRYTVKIVKNSQVCVTCHNTIKLLSEITGRVVILKDDMRFHHFWKGKCSCGDYW